MRYLIGLLLLVGAWHLGPEIKAEKIPIKPKIQIVKSVKIDKKPTVKKRDVVERERRPETVKQYAKRLSGNEYPALDDLWGNHESGWNNYAQNPHSSAYGIAQFLDGTWSTVGCTKTSYAKEQIRCGLKYIKKRYGSVSNALKFRHVHGYY